MAAMACNHQAINGLSLEPLTNAKSVALKADACSSQQELSANMHEQCKTVPEYSFYESTIYMCGCGHVANALRVVFLREFR